MKRLLFLLGDQLSPSSPCFELLNPQTDLILLAEVKQESTKVTSHKIRTTYFLSAMRHFAEELKKTFQVRYITLDDPQNTHSLVGELKRAIAHFSPDEIHLIRPGEYQIRQDLLAFNPIEHEDPHFFTSPADFARHAHGRKQLRMEFFYREQRKATNYLMDKGKPLGGQWNFDQENRQSFGKHGPDLLIPPPLTFPPDSITREVIHLVEKTFPHHPGDLSTFNWPVTPAHAQEALEHFIEHRLPSFGKYQDAMWTDSPWLSHSLISAALNLKLLDPRQVCQAAINAYHSKKAPLAAVEGFVRQILGWREYVRGLYWLKMPDYLNLNALNAHQNLPDFYWSGQTEFTCLSQTIKQTLKFGYAHHIQRLMVTGLFAMMYGVDPIQIHQWYLAVYLDAVEWVELPNTTGMSQWADGGIMASKPYAATGKYLQRMSNYCSHCPRNPALRTGPKACPFTTLYWDFLLQHRTLLAQNQRMSLQLRNLDRLSPTEITEIQKTAAAFRSQPSSS